MLNDACVIFDVCVIFQVTDTATAMASSPKVATVKRYIRKLVFISPTEFFAAQVNVFTHVNITKYTGMIIYPYMIL